MNAYLKGTDILGAGGSYPRRVVLGASFTMPQPAGAGAESYLTIHVKNIPELVAKQGGGMGTLALSLAPSTIAGKVYGTMREKMLAKFAEEGVQADVTVTTTPPVGPPPKAEFLRGAAVGIGAVGIGWGLWKVVGSLFGRKRS